MRILAAICSLGVAVASAAEPQVVVVEESRGAFIVPVSAIEYREVQKQVAMQVNGRTVVQTVTEKVPVSVVKHVTVDAKAGDFLDRAGRPLDPKAVAALLKAGTVLAVSPDGTPVGPDLLKKNGKIAAILLLKPAAKDKGPAPKLGILGKNGDGSLHVEVTITEQVLVAETRTKRHNGRLVTETVTVPVSHTYKARHSLADATVTDLGGNPVDLKTLRAGSKVAVSADYRPVDPSHVNELKGVVAVVVPTELVAP